MFKHSLLLTVVALAGTPAAHAATEKTHHLRPAGPDRVDSVLSDCAHDGDLDRRFRLVTLRWALRHVPADVANYTDCVRIIRRDIRRRR